MKPEPILLKQTFTVDVSHNAQDRKIGIGIVIQETPLNARRRGSIIEERSETFSYFEVPPNEMELFAIFRAFEISIERGYRHTVQAVFCDLYDGYMNACKDVFKKKVPIVADRFHVRKLYRASLVNLRKSELIRLRKTLTETEYAELKSAIAILRKQKDYFTDEEKPIVEKLFLLSPRLKLTYQFSRNLSGIFDSHVTPAEAKEKMISWIEDVTHSELSCFNKFIKTLTKYQQEITNYFIQRNNSGFVEGFNNKVKVLKRRCYDLSSATKLFQRLIIDTLGMLRFTPAAAAF